MNQATLNYVRQYADDDVRLLALRGSKDSDVDLTLALQQIQGRQTAKRKLPSWAAIEGVLYPPRLSMEQCSSEATARYKTGIIYDLLNKTSPPQSGSQFFTFHSSLFPSQSGSQFFTFHSSLFTLIDLTGGFGVDLAFMSQAFHEAVYVEQSEELCLLAQHNMPLVTTTPVTVVCADGMEYLKTIDHCAMLFLDPARRDVKGARTYALADCTPNVVPLIPHLLSKADYVMLKLSPMLDWRKAVFDVGAQYVSQVHIVALDNECKELLLLLRSPLVGTDSCICPPVPAHSPMKLICADISSASGITHTFAVEVQIGADASVGAGPVPARSGSQFFTFHSSLFPSLFLYEPNAAIMKAGCFEALSHAFAVAPLAHDSHLFVSESRVEDFPGRRFIIDAVMSMNKAELKQTLAGIKRANITVRHFPLTAEELRKRLRLADGGEAYIFATTLADGSHRLLLCHKDK